MEQLNRYFATTLTGVFLSGFTLLGTVMLVITTLIHQVDIRSGIAQTSAAIASQVGVIQGGAPPCSVIH